MKPSLKPVLVLIIFAVSVATYYVTLGNGFVGDDHTLIENNPWLTSLSNLPDVFASDVHAFQSENPVTDYYRPLLFTIYMVEYALFGLEPWGWHLFNVLFHAANAVVVFLLASRILRKRDEGGGLVFPFLASLLFAAHPVNTESVSWLACICELAYTLFGLLSLYLYILSTDATRGKTLAIRALSLFSLLLATFSKETALVFPAIILGYGLFVERRPGALIRSIPYWCVAVFYLLLRMLALERLVPAAKTPMGLFYYVSNVFTMTWVYMKKLIAPFGMSIYNVADAPEAFGPELAAYGAAFIALALALVLLAGKDKRSAFLASIIILPMLPTLVLLNKSVDIYYINRVAERFLYLPMAGAAMLAALWLKNLYGLAGNAAARKAVLAASFAVIAALAALSAQRASYWKDDFTVWKKAIDDNPENYFAHYIMGVLYSSEGLDEKAIGEYKEAIRLRPTLTGPHQRLGLTYVSNGRHGEAAVEFREVLKVNPENGDALYNLGFIHMRAQDWGGAEPIFKQALDYNRGSRLVRIHNALAVVYANLGRLDDARKSLEEAYRLAPQDRETLDNIMYFRDNFGIEIM